MRATLRSALSPLAIPTKYLESAIFGPTIPAKLFYDLVLSRCRHAFLCSAMLGTIVIHMVKSQKRILALATASAAATISVDHLLAKLPAPSLSIRSNFLRITLVASAHAITKPSLLFLMMRPVPTSGFGVY